MNSESSENMEVSENDETSSSESQISPNDEDFIHDMWKENRQMYTCGHLHVSGSSSSNSQTASNDEEDFVHGAGKENVHLSEPSSTSSQIVSNGEEDLKTERPFVSRLPMKPIRKHYLLSTWTMWYLEHDRSRAWDEKQNEIVSFDAVEEFWMLYNRIKQPASLSSGSDYSLFRKGIRPMWEDEGNKFGGRWIVTLNKTSNEVLNNLWLDTVLIIIGEKFAHSDQVCGVVINVRTRIDKISIWTKNCHDKNCVLKLGCFFRDVLNLGMNKLQFHAHVDTIYRHGSNVRPIYIV